MALLLASAAVPASAHDWNDDNGGYGYNGYGYNGYGYNNGSGDNGYYQQNYYDVVRQHVRACREHERFHQRLAEIHNQLHDEGFDSYSEHQDVHDALDAAHDAYHETHGEPRDCGYWYSQYSNWNRGTSWGHRYYQPYRNSWSAWSNN
jgi:hypothetical protein